jgi:hypothetical protein
MSAASSSVRHSVELRAVVILSGHCQVLDAGIPPSCFMREDVDDPHVSAISPSVKRTMKISL